MVSSFNLFHRSPPQVLLRQSQSVDEKPLRARNFLYHTIYSFFLPISCLIFLILGFICQSNFQGLSLDAKLKDFLAMIVEIDDIHSEIKNIDVIYDNDEKSIYSKKYYPYNNRKNLISHLKTFEEKNFYLTKSMNSENFIGISRLKQLETSLETYHNILKAQINGYQTFDKQSQIYPAHVTQSKFSGSASGLRTGFHGNLSSTLNQDLALKESRKNLDRAFENAVFALHENLDFHITEYQKSTNKMQQKTLSILLFIILLTFGIAYIIGFSFQKL